LVPDSIYMHQTMRYIQLHKERRPKHQLSHLEGSMFPHHKEYMSRTIHRGSFHSHM
jgi:hypothetical protein